jgi:hypothetical protein
MANFNNAIDERKLEKDPSAAYEDFVLHVCLEMLDNTQSKFY